MFDKGWTGLFKQATEMQSKLAEIQEGLAEKTVEVSTGGGMVKVVANGLNEIISIKIDDELINMSDREVLEDLMAAAINEVSKKVKELAQEEMTKITGGLKSLASSHQLDKKNQNFSDKGATLLFQFKKLRPNTNGGTP